MTLLATSLGAVRRVYDADGLLTQLSQPKVSDYYRQSLLGYLAVQCRRGAIHFALDDGDFEAQARAVGDMIDESGGRDALELASGLGFNSILLGQRAPRVAITGIDITPAHVRLARLRGRRLANVTFEHGDMHRLRFGARSFDIVFSVEGFCYANGLQTALREVTRVLRPGGRFVLFDGFLRRRLETMTAEERAAVRLVDTGMAVTRTWTLDDLVHTSAQNGLRVLGVEDLSHRILPNVERLAHHARRFFARPRLARIADTLLPSLLIRNGITAILAPAVAHVYGYYAISFEDTGRP